MFADRPDLPLEAPDRGDGFPTPSWLIGLAGRIPDRADPATGFAPRGALVEAGSPAFPYTELERDRVWAQNVASLYDQATAQQWDASTDIAWDELPALPSHVERAVGQIMTHLAENEYAALYVPSKFIPRIHPHFTEVVLFLATQVVDEARHIEAFTKRALASGGRARHLRGDHAALAEVVARSGGLLAGVVPAVGLGRGRVPRVPRVRGALRARSGHRRRGAPRARRRVTSRRVRRRARAVVPSRRSGARFGVAAGGGAARRVPVADARGRRRTSRRRW